jgi:hypothetical protein
MTAAAIVGFLLAAVAQRKGFAYHFLPALCLSALLLARLAFGGARRPDLVLAAFLAAFAAQTWGWLESARDTSPIERQVRALTARPGVFVIAADPAVAYPMIRNVEGFGFDQKFTGWIPYYINGLLSEGLVPDERLPAMRDFIERERRMLADDLDQDHPDVLLVQRRPFDMWQWARKDARLAALLDCFEHAGGASVGLTHEPDASPPEVEILLPAACPARAARNE